MRKYLKNIIFNRFLIKNWLKVIKYAHFWIVGNI